MSCVHGPNSRFENKDPGCLNPNASVETESNYLRLNLKSWHLNTTHQLSKIMLVFPQPTLILSVNRFEKEP